MAGLFGDDVSGSGAFESGGFVGLAFFLKLVQFGHFPFAAAGETRFLQVDVAELLFVFEGEFEIDHIGFVG